MEYENRHKVKDDVLESLKDEYGENTTNMVAKKLGKNWYTVSRYLTELWVDGKVEKLELGRNIYWKKKPDNELSIIN